METEEEKDCWGTSSKHFEMIRNRYCVGLGVSHFHHPPSPVTPVALGLVAVVVVWTGSCLTLC